MTHTTTSQDRGAVSVDVMTPSGSGERWQVIDPAACDFDQLRQEASLGYSNREGPAGTLSPYELAGKREARLLRQLRPIAKP